MYDLLIGLGLGGVALAAGVFIGNKIGQRQQARDESASESSSE